MKCLFLDHTKTSNASHKSGLNRFNVRIAEELEALFPGQVFRVRWNRWRRSLVHLDSGEKVKPASDDVYLNGEAFDPRKLWGWVDFIQRWPGKTVAVFHDNIPETHPELCFPHVVKRHPKYLKALLLFQSVCAVSQASLDALRLSLGAQCPPGAVIALGADFHEIVEWDITARLEKLKQTSYPIRALTVGIIEPRKNQEAVLGAQRILAEQGRELKLEFVGRVNDSLGPKIMNLINAQASEGFDVKWSGALSDEDLEKAYERADILIFPSIAEGFGLPPFEALARGVPCLTSHTPGADEHLQDAPLLWLDDPNAEAIAAGIDRFVGDVEFREAFVERSHSFEFPAWKQVAERVARHVGLVAS